MHWLSSHLFLFFSWLDVRPVCVYIASLWLFTWNISPSHLSLHDCSSYSSIWQSFSLPPFLLPLILIHNLARHSFPYLSCLSVFLPSCLSDWAAEYSVRVYRRAHSLPHLPSALSVYSHILVHVRTDGAYTLFVRGTVLMLRSTIGSHDTALEIVRFFRTLWLHVQFSFLGPMSTIYTSPLTSMSCSSYTLFFAFFHILFAVTPPWNSFVAIF